MRSSDNWCSFWIVTPIYTFAYMLITLSYNNPCPSSPSSTIYIYIYTHTHISIYLYIYIAIFTCFPLTSTAVTDGARLSTSLPNNAEHSLTTAHCRYSPALSTMDSSLALTVWASMRKNAPSLSYSSLRTWACGISPCTELSSCTSAATSFVRSSCAKLQ